MKAKLIACAAIFAFQASAIVHAAGEGWSTDFAAAQKEAVKSKKDLLIDFTGSDWCGWCIKLNEEVFSQQPFKDGVKDKFVLVELDYPRDKSKLTEATIEQNDELQKKYGVKGFPTILLTDSAGKPYARTGYQEGGPEKYVAHLDQLRAKKDARDEFFKSAESAEGVEKAKALQSALNAMALEDGMVEEFYGDVVEQLKAADPGDETGFVKAAARKEQLVKFQEELSKLAQGGDFDGALALVDKTIAEGGFEKDDTQQLMATRGMVFAQLKKFDEAIQAVDEAKAFAPESEMAPALDGFKKQLEEAKAKETGAEAKDPAAE